MYKIIGADGKEYGPISADTVRQWISEGRANQLTRILPEGSTEWKPLGEVPEFATAVPFSSTQGGPQGQGTSAWSPEAGASAPPGPMSSSPFGGPMFPPVAPDAAEKVNGPGIGLIVVGALSLVFGVPSLLMHFAGVNFLPTNLPPEANWLRVMMGPLGIVTNLISIALGALILFGGIKMRALQNYGLAMAAAILSIVPCTTSCCLVGIPIGIWALVVLLKPEVKSSFR